MQRSLFYNLSHQPYMNDTIGLKTYIKNKQQKQNNLVVLMIIPTDKTVGITIIKTDTYDCFLQQNKKKRNENYELNTVVSETTRTRTRRVRNNNYFVKD